MAREPPPLPCQHRGGIELGRRVGEQPLHRLLTARTDPVERACDVQRLLQCSSAHAETRSGEQNPARAITGG
jgi:hypothetical protein